MDRLTEAEITGLLFDMSSGGGSTHRLVDRNQLHRLITEVVDRRNDECATMTASGWQTIHDDATERVRRMAVPGGWLYQSERWDTEESSAHGAAPIYINGWYPPVFVPEVVK